MAEDSKEKLRKGALSDLDNPSKSNENDLFPHSNTRDEAKRNIDNVSDLNVQLQAPNYVAKSKGGSSSRRYRKQSKNKFKGKNIETDFQLQRNDPLLNISSIMTSNMGTNQTMQIFASSGVTSPVVGNMSMSKGFVVPSTTKHSKFTSSRRPVSAVMGKRVSPHSSVELPMFDLNRMRPRNIKRDKMTLYDDAMKLKKANNNMLDENLKLKTNLHKLENE